jgi:transcriptional regulator with XRE-family HTH domain
MPPVESNHIYSRYMPPTPAPQGQPFGEWLRDRRKEAGLNQEQLAKSARISLPYVSKLERGARHSLSNAAPTPAVEVVDRLARALGVDLQVARDAAFGQSSPSREKEGELSKLQREFDSLPENDRAELHAVVDYLAAEIRRRKRQHNAAPMHLSNFDDVDRVRAQQKKKRSGRPR